MATTHRIARRLVTATPPSSSLVTARKLPTAHARTQRSLLLPRTGARYASSSASASESASESASAAASAAASTATKSQPVSRAKALIFAASLAASGYFVYVYATDTRAFVHRYVVPPLLRTVFPDAEDAHNAAVGSMKILYELGLNPRERPGASATTSQDPDISIQVFGDSSTPHEHLANPIGISAGLDKHAEIPDALFALGAAVVEVGGCTPLAQAGNPRPRMFRIPVLDGLVNRYGLNSRGADDVARRLRERVRRFARAHGLTEAEVLAGAAGVPPGSLIPGRLLAVQIAKNKDTDERDVAAVQRDYVYCVSRLAPYADVLVVNVSSPNTPGLRDLQAAEPLARILGGVVEEARRASDHNRARPPRVMVKVSPDEDEDAQLEGIAQAVWASGVDGVIVGNTTKRRAGVVPPGVRLSPRERAALAETGGYSGPAMFDRTEALVARYRTLLDTRALQQQYQRQAATAANGDDAGAKKVVDDEAVDASLAGIEGTITGVVEDTSPTSKKTREEAVAARGPAAAEPKAIWATGGITNGQQALRILNAGASVAMVYTSLVYGGAGTVTRIKREMKSEMAAAADGEKEKKGLGLLKSES
ncbi:Dihydroorotate dehydrogenase (quinone), mitochondrial [Diatrype stigma]|uniref:Dihydroorotate dehydrogenase (Quinone), mitochondrial n=1 Tax=Diatrype stigma TaxID=117547 RepID=A0AAN9UNI2_9PEZI